jgi:hypothetical protein
MHDELRSFRFSVPEVLDMGHPEPLRFGIFGFLEDDHVALPWQSPGVEVAPYVVSIDE